MIIQIVKYIFLFLTAIYSLQCRNQSNPSITDSSSITSFSVTGIAESEKITAVSDSGEFIDINAKGQIFLSGTSFPATAGSIEIVNQPSGKSCSVLPELTEDSSGEIQWKIICNIINYYNVSASVTGLSGNLHLQLNDTPAVVINNNGKFTFPQKLSQSTPYQVKIFSHPRNPDQLCSIEHGKGVVEKNIDGIQVVCSSDVFLLSGTVSGQKSGFSIQNSNGDSMFIPAGAYNFSLAEFIPSGASYHIEIQTPPYRQDCYIKNGMSAKIKSDISNIKIVCAEIVALNATTGLSARDNSRIGDNKNIHFWFYLDQNQIVYPEFKKIIPYKSGKILSLQAPAGDYYVRTFIDMDQNGKPGIGYDYQSQRIFWQGRPHKTNSISLYLQDTSDESGFHSFNAYILTTSEWQQPRGGKCGGTHVKLEAGNFQGNQNHISAAYVLLPDQTIRELLNDGGCGDAYNNLAESYDQQSGDMVVSAGIDQKHGIQAGDYTFYYVNYVSDHIHVFTDNIASSQPLTSFIQVTSPTGENPVQSPKIPIQWNSIPGAASYEILLESTDHVINNYRDPYRFVNISSYYPPFPLLDEKAYKINIQAFDSDITARENIPEYDAVSQSPDQYFITDFSGENSIQVTGNMNNASLSSGSYLIYGDSNIENGSWESSVFLPPKSTQYTLSVFKNTGKYGALISGINVDESGYLLSDVNRVYARWNNSLYMPEKITLDLIWTKPFFLLEPVNNQSGTGVYPVFSWEDYAPYITTAHSSYLLWITPVNSNSRPAIIGLEDHRINFNHARITSHTDASNLYACFMENNKIQSSESSCGYEPEINPSDIFLEKLKEQTQWEWKVVIIPCRFEQNQYYTDENKNSRADYMDCLLQIFSGEKPAIAESLPSMFYTY